MELVDLVGLVDLVDLVDLHLTLGVRDSQGELWNLIILYLHFETHQKIQLDPEIFRDFMKLHSYMNIGTDVVLGAVHQGGHNGEVGGITRQRHGGARVHVHQRLPRHL